ncbi:cysteine--tRNA ligase, partial [Candidatus Dojkabacteria bacterium]|nr:cysteine--tRNA ligase [Candidatus Dojkabacteria bacterium]
LGNIYTLDDLEEKGFDPLDYRYFLLQAHYRSKQNFTWEALEGAKSARNKLVAALDWTQTGGELIAEFTAKFKQALESDFNLPQALAVSWEVLKADNTEEDKIATLLDLDKVLGLQLDRVEKQQTQKTPPEVQNLLKQREQARTEKDFEKADQFRDEIIEKFGGRIEDKEGKSTWQSD